MEPLMSEGMFWFILYFSATILIIYLFKSKKPKEPSHKRFTLIAKEVQKRKKQDGNTRVEQKLKNYRRQSSGLEKKKNRNPEKLNKQQNVVNNLEKSESRNSQVQMNDETQFRNYLLKPVSSSQSVKLENILAQASCPPYSPDNSHNTPYNHFFVDETSRNINSKPKIASIYPTLEELASDALQFQYEQKNLPGIHPTHKQVPLTAPPPYNQVIPSEQVNFVPFNQMGNTTKNESQALVTKCPEQENKPNTPTQMTLNFDLESMLPLDHYYLYGAPHLPFLDLHTHNLEEKKDALVKIL